MCAPFQAHSCGCGGHACGCGEFLTADEEIRRMEVMQLHLQLQLDLIGRRLESLRKVAK